MELNRTESSRQMPWHVLFGIILVLVSAVIYAAQILIFHREGETFFLMMQDFAFVPISVLLVTLIVEGVLNYREKKALQTKLYMVIGTFFTEMGMELLRLLSSYDTNLASFRKVLSENASFEQANVDRILKYLSGHDCRIKTEPEDLSQLKQFMTEKRDAVMRLLENPNLLEHETFTSLLWAVSHLTEELAYRKDLKAFSPADRKHLDLDIERAYGLLIAEWVAYVRHLRVHYPFIFSLVLRINPFDPEYSAEVKE